MMTVKRVYIDTETTGLKPGQIAQISYIVEDNNSVAKVVNQFFTVESMEAGASQVTGFTVDCLRELSNGMKFEDRSDEILSDLSNAIIIAHNSAFDIRFISAEYNRLGISFIPDKSFCTMKNFTNMLKLPGGKRGYKYPNLQELLRFSRISDNDVSRCSSVAFRNNGLSSHDARFDSTAVYLICKKLEKCGVIDIEKTIEMQSM